MIKSFKHKGLKRFFETGSKRGIQASHESKLQLILTALDNAELLEDLNIPAFRLHTLSGRGQNIYSVWVNGNWRITFRFIKSNAEIVNYEDYH